MRRRRTRGPSGAGDSPDYFVIGIHIIIGMPPHIIMTGAPIAIIEFMASQRSFMRAIIEASIGIIFMTMPSFVISQDILHIIGAMPLIIIGIIMGMPIGIMPIEFIWPPMGIIGIMPMGIPPFMPFMPFIIGMGMGMGIPFIGIPFIAMPFIGIPFIIGIDIAFMESSIESCGSRAWVEPRFVVEPL